MYNSDDFISFLCFYVFMLFSCFTHLDRFYWSFQLGITGSGTDYKKLEHHSQVRSHSSSVCCGVSN